MKNPDPIASIVVKITDDTQESFERLIQSLERATGAIEKFANLLQDEIWMHKEQNGTQDER